MPGRNPNGRPSRNRVLRQRTNAPALFPGKRGTPVLLLALLLVSFLASAPAPIPAASASAATSLPDPAAPSPLLCPPLDPPAGPIVNVATVPELESAVNGAAPGDTILVADGVYNLDGVYLRIDTPNVTLRSASGDRDAVVLDGNYVTTEIVQIVASGVTVADLTLREAYYHPIHVMSAGDAHTLNTLIYNVHIVDPGEQAIKINPVSGGFYPDNGEIACSHLELTAAGRTQIRNNCYTGGVDAHQARDWVVRDNVVEGFWCASGLSEHAVHFWRGSRDTVVERNLLRDNARGAGFGLVTSGDGRTYADDVCPAAGDDYVDHFGGVIRNNFVVANDNALFASQYGFDCGVCLWNACDARALHNTVFTSDPASTFSAVEWRFPNTQAEVSNNLTNHVLRERDGAGAAQTGNVTAAQASWFVDAPSGDLHLASTAVAAIDQATPLAAVTDDYDGDLRPAGAAPDVGADEFGGAPFTPDHFLHLPLTVRAPN